MEVGWMSVGDMEVGTGVPHAAARVGAPDLDVRVVRSGEEPRAAPVVADAVHGRTVAHEAARMIACLNIPHKYLALVATCCA